MIGEITLEALCNQYGIDSSKVIRNNQNVLDFGEYLEIKKVLDYLVKELGISAKNIEKCPSILYLNVNAIKYNYEFLRCHTININDVETCLHVLSTDPQELQKTYSYVLNNYGEKYLNSITSILRVSVGRIIQIENLFNDCDKSVILSASISRRTIDEIKEIIKVCKENNIDLSGTIFHRTASEIEEIIKVCKENNINPSGNVFRRTASEIKEIIQVCKENNIAPSGTVFHRTANEIEKIITVCKENNIVPSGNVFRRSANEIEEVIKVCKKNNIDPSGNVFLKSASEIEEIIKVCKKNNIDPSGNVFLKSASEIEEIIKVCKENNIDLTGSVFLKSAKQLQINIDYIKNNYGGEYLTSLIVCKNLKQLEELMSYLKEKGVLEILINSASILTLKLDEIKDREEFILSIGETITTNGKFNSIFGLSRKNYQIKKEKYKVIK